MLMTHIRQTLWPQALRNLFPQYIGERERCRASQMHCLGTIGEREYSRGMYRVGESRDFPLPCTFPFMLLFSQIQIGQYGAIPFDIAIMQVIQQTAAFSHQS